MTWKQLKTRINKLSDEQLKGQVCFQDDYDNLMNLNLYIQKDSKLENPEWGTEVNIGMPKFGL